MFNDVCVESFHRQQLEYTKAGVILRTLVCPGGKPARGSTCIRTNSKILSGIAITNLGYLLLCKVLIVFQVRIRERKALDSKGLIADEVKNLSRKQVNTLLRNNPQPKPKDKFKMHESFRRHR